MHKERDAMGNMKIDRTNYEEFIIGYLEGELDPVRSAELLIFLEQNPDLKAEANDLASISLKPDAGITYDFKDSLLQPADTDARHLNKDNHHHYFIAALEGDLSPEGMDAVDRFIQQNPGLKKAYQLYSQARLSPDENIVFSNSASLRKREKAGLKTILYFTSAAASILLLIALFLRQEPGLKSPVADAYLPQENLPQQVKADDSSKVRTTRLPEAREAEKQTTKPVRVGEKKAAQPAVAPPSENKSREKSEINRVPSKQTINNTPEPFNVGGRNFYSELYDDILKSQEPLLASLEQVNEETGRLPAAGSRPARRFNNLILTGARIVSQVPSSFNGWMLADLGIEGFNMLTDNDIELRRVIKPNGQTEKLIISGNGSGYAISRKNN